MNNIQEYIISVRDRFSASANKILGKTQELDKNVNTLNNDMGNLGSHSLFGDVFGGMAAFAAAQQALLEIKSFADHSVDMAEKAGETEAAFQIILRSKDAADEAMHVLDQYNQKSLLLPETIHSAGEMLISLGVNADKAGKLISQLGDVALGNADKFNSMLDVYARIQQRGYISARELNVFTQAGVPIFDELGKMIGKSGVELRKYMTEGTVTATQLETALNNLTGAGGQFEDAQEKMAASAPWLAVRRNVAVLETTIGNQLLPIYEKAMTMFSGFLQFMEDHSSVIRGAAVAVSALAGALAGVFIAEKLVAVFEAVSVAFSSYTAATETATVATEGFGVALDATGIGGILALLGAATAAYTTLDLTANSAANSVAKLNSALEDTKLSEANALIDIIRNAKTAEEAQKNLGYLNKLLATRKVKPLTMNDVLYQWGNDPLKDFAAAAGREKPAGPPKAPSIDDDIANGIAGGGVKNLTINLGKFFDNLIFQGTTIDKDIETAGALTMKQFMRLLYSAGKTQSGAL